MPSHEHRVPSYPSRKGPRLDWQLIALIAWLRIGSRIWTNPSGWGMRYWNYPGSVTCSFQEPVVGSTKLRLRQGEGSVTNTKLQHCFQKKGNECYIGKSHSYIPEILFLVFFQMETIVENIYLLKNAFSCNNSFFISYSLKKSFFHDTLLRQYNLSI